MTTSKLTIAMSERRPVEIDTDEWPVIARSDWFNGQHDFQANYVRYIVVREHADGRRIVYGSHCAGRGGVPVGWRGSSGGFIVDATGEREDDTIHAIRRVSGIIGDTKMAAECISDLPAETF
jgi:hypothetical protein